jgi:hypothetical protein
VQNLDNFCLFYALELARIFHDQTEINALKKDGGDVKGLISNQVFSNIRNNPDRQRTMAVELMSALKIPQTMQQYGIEHLQAVQEYYDQVILSFKKTNFIHICRNIRKCIVLYVFLTQKFQLLYGMGLLGGNMRLPFFMRKLTLMP